MVPAPAPAPAAGAAPRGVHVFYATQTGNAAEIARRIAADLPGAAGPARCLSEAPAAGVFEAGGAVVLVVATTGDGDVPDSVRPFSRLLRKAAKEKAFAGVEYAMLGLGDTNYENFCGAANRIESQMVKAGAEAFYPTGKADDGTGMEDVVEPWVEGLAPTVAALLSRRGDPCVPSVAAAAPPAPSVEAAVAAAVKEELLSGFDASDLPPALPPSVAVDPFSGEYAAMDSTSPHYDHARTLRGALVSARLLANAPGRRVYHVELDVGAGLGYLPGDAFGVLVHNSASDVERALARLADADASRARSDDELWRLRALDGARSVLATGGARELLRERVELRAPPKKTLLRALAEHCANEADRVNLYTLAAKPTAKARKEGMAYFDDVVSPGLGVLDVLDKFAPSCRPPLALLLDQVVPLAPRYYSAASAPKKDGDRLHFAFSVVKGGLATTALAARADAAMRGVDPADIPPVLIVPRASDAASVFRPPAQLSTPYVMVGPGTGVAPFRGFLRQRAAQLEDAHGDDVGEAMLFYGCRNEASDFLYEDELKAFAASPVLSSLDVAFSRDGPAKVYVQDLLMKKAKTVARVLEAGGSFFVCGDGGGMATGVDKALHGIVADHICDGDAAAAKVYVKKLAQDHRYVRDIWYFGTVEE